MLTCANCGRQFKALVGNRLACSTSCLNDLRIKRKCAENEVAVHPSWYKEKSR